MPRKIVMEYQIPTEYIPYLLLLAGSILIAVAFLYDPPVNVLTKTGILTEGVVFSKEYDGHIERPTVYPLEYTVYSKLTIRFTTKDQEWITADRSPEFSNHYSGQFKEGDRVQLYYEEQNPRNFYVVAKQSITLKRILGALIGVGLLTVGIFRLFVVA